MHTHYPAIPCAVHFSGGLISRPNYAAATPARHIYWYLQFKKKLKGSGTIADAAGKQRHPFGQKSQKRSSGKGNKVGVVGGEGAAAEDAAEAGAAASATGGGGKAENRPVFVTTKSLDKWESFDKKSKLLNVTKLSEMTPICLPVEGQTDAKGKQVWAMASPLDGRWSAHGNPTKNIKLHCGPNHLDPAPLE